MAGSPTWTPGRTRRHGSELAAGSWNSRTGHARPTGSRHTGPTRPRHTRTAHPRHATHPGTWVLDLEFRPDRCPKLFEYALFGHAVRDEPLDNDHSATTVDGSAL